MRSRLLCARNVGWIIVLAFLLAACAVSWSAMKVTRWAEACGHYPPEVECPLDPERF